VATATKRDSRRPTPAKSVILIYITTALLLAAIMASWFYSATTRRLARFALIAIAIGAALFGLYLLVIVLWFPVAL
jgi:hypothetical protein